MTTIHEKPFPMGKSLVTALARLTDTGTCAPSVSIRSGRDTREGARRCAATQGMHWLRQPA